MNEVSNDKNLPIEMDWLKQWSLFSPKNIAFKDAESNVEYSYHDLYYLSCVLATNLRERFSIAEGSRVAVLATNELEFIPLFFALQRLGAVMVPINFRLTAHEISHILTDSAPHLVIYQTQFQDVITKAGISTVPEKKWHFDGAESLRSFLSAALSQVLDGTAAKQNWIVPMKESAAFETVCMILYTSGTTGLAKGALVTNQMLHWNSINTTLRLNLNESDVALTFLPFFHTSGWNVLVTPFLHRGAKTILLRKFDAHQVLTLSEREGATILFGVPTTMDMMARDPIFESVNLSKVRYAIVGGEPMAIDLIKLWEKKGVAIRQGYGLTEFGPNVFSLNETDSIRKIGSIGFPNFYIQAKVVNDRNEEVPDGEIGELVLRGPVCSPGYWNNPKATAETIQNSWLHTGDLVRKDEEGYFYVAGRKKDMFISGGENVYPVELERVLSTHPAIREIAVIGVPDAKWGEVGKACVVLNQGAQLSAEDLLKFCRDLVAKFKVPKYVEFYTELPKGDSGKILKRKLNESMPKHTEVVSN